MIRGLIIWLRFRGITWAAITSALLLALVATFLAAIVAVSDTPTTSRTMFFPFIIAVTWGRILLPATDMERIALRSRWILSALPLLLSLIVSATVSLTLSFSPTWDYGSAAMFRNSLAMLAIVALSAKLLSNRFYWAIPAVLFIYSVVFTPGAQPTQVESAIQFLRMPGGLWLPDGSLDLSWIITALLIAAACGSPYWRLPHLFRVRPIRPHSNKRGLYPGFVLGFLRNSHALPLGTAMAMLLIVMSVQSLTSWGGSPVRALNSEVISNPAKFLIIFTVVSVVIGQTRWRSGLSRVDALAIQRKRLSPLWLAITVATITTITAYCVYALTIYLIALTGAYLDGVSLTLIFRDSLKFAPGIAIMLFYILFSTVMGSAIGYFLRAWWIPALAAVSSLIVFSFLPTISPFNQSSQIDLILADPHCVGDNLRVCAEERNTAYLEVAHKELQHNYESFESPELLPSTVFLVDDHIDPPPAGHLYFDLKNDRGFTVPESLPYLSSEITFRSAVIAVCATPALDALSETDVSKLLACVPPEDRYSPSTG